MCVGAYTPLYFPVLEYHYFSQGRATSGILSSLSLLYILDIITVDAGCFFFKHVHLHVLLNQQETFTGSKHGQCSYE
jgi:hypothetical protein